MYVCIYVWMGGCMHVRMHVNKQTKNIIITIIIMVAIITYKTPNPGTPILTCCIQRSNNSSKVCQAWPSRLVLPYAIFMWSSKYLQWANQREPCILQEGQETLKASPETSKMSCLWCFLDFAWMSQSMPPQITLPAHKGKEQSWTHHLKQKSFCLLCSFLAVG